MGVWIRNESNGDWRPSTVYSKTPIENQTEGFEIGLRDEDGNEMTLTVTSLRSGQLQIEKRRQMGM